MLNMAKIKLLITQTHGEGARPNQIPEPLSQEATTFRKEIIKQEYFRYLIFIFVLCGVLTLF